MNPAATGAGHRAWLALCALIAAAALLLPLALAARGAAGWLADAPAAPTGPTVSTLPALPTLPAASTPQAPPTPPTPPTPKTAAAPQAPQMAAAPPAMPMPPAAAAAPGLSASTATATDAAAWALRPGDGPWQRPARWWTGALLHWSAWHLAGNLLALALVAALGARAGCGRAEALAGALTWPMSGLLLLLLAPRLAPGLAQYAGLSGVLHGLVLLVGLRLVGLGRVDRHRQGRQHGDPVPRPAQRQRRVGLALLAGLLLKLLAEALLPPGTVAGSAVPVAPLGHLCGVLAALLAAGLVALAGLARAGRLR